MFIESRAACQGNLSIILHDEMVQESLSLTRKIKQQLDSQPCKKS